MRTRSSHVLAVALLCAGTGCKFPELPPIDDDASGDAASPDGLEDAAATDAGGDAAPVDAAPGPFLLTFGSTGIETAKAAINGAGQIAVAGVMAAPSMIGANAVSAGLYVTKLGADGSIVWVSSFEGSFVYVNGVAMTESGDVIVVGRLDGTLSFGASSLISSGPDGFLIKLSSATGAVLQTRLVSGSSSTTFEDWDGINAVAVDAAGNAYVTGHFAGTASPCGIQRTSAGNWDVFIARYNAAALLCDWDRVYGSPEQDVGNAIATDGVGVFVGASSYGTLNAGGSSLPAGASSDVVVARYTAVGGGHSWSFRYNGVGENVKAAAAGDGAAFFAGTLTGAISFGGAPIGGTQQEDLFVVRFTASNGAHAWSKSVPGGATTDTVNSLVFASGGVHYAGAFSGAANFGGQGLNSAGNSDAVRAAYDLPNGTHIDSSATGGGAQDALSLSAPSPYGHVLVGTFGGTVMLGSEQRTAAGGSDVFVMRQ